MKYKAGDKVIIQNHEWIIIQVNEDSYDINSTKNKYLYSTITDKHIALFEKKTPTHEDTITHLNELNTSKTRKIERLMKHIAKGFNITPVCITTDKIRSFLIESIKDEDLVNEIMFHVRKGK